LVRGENKDIISQLSEEEKRLSESEADCAHLSLALEGISLTPDEVTVCREGICGCLCRLIPNHGVNVVVNLWFCVYLVFGLNVSQDTGFTDRLFLWVSSVSPGKAGKVCLLGHNCFLPNPLQFINHKTFWCCCGFRF
jgi:hypothetical protein